MQNQFNNRLNRRQFLGTTIGTGLAGAKVFSATAAGKVAAAGSNDRINMALIGCGARGRHDMQNFMALPGVRIIAVCDLNSKHLAMGRKQAGGKKVAAYHDYRKLLENKDIEAVIVATQPHWHTLVTIAACQAGKDVYMEKPVGNSIGEGAYIIDAAKKYKRVVQIGTQQRSCEHYHRAVEVVRSGKLGQVSEVKIWDYENWWPGAGFPPDCDPPAELDWDFYVGPAPYQAYNPNIYYNYGYDWFKLSGAGHQVAWGVHHLDIVLWAMGVDSPVSVSATGGNYAFQDNHEWPNTLTANLEFGPGPVAKHGFVLQYTMRVGCRREVHSHGKCFLGSEASMMLDRSGYYVVADINRTSKKKMDPGRYLINNEEKVEALNDDSHHCGVFLENIYSRKQPFANPVTGQHATNLGHLMNISWQVKRTILWDGKKEQVIGDPEANTLVRKPYRAPWKLVV